MTIADAQLERVLADVNLGDAVALVDDMADIPLKSQCCDWRISPVSYLQKTFKSALMLLAVMFDTGCLLSGSRALEYFVPGSCGPGSDWDFYVTAYKESVADMVNVLKACGVVWHAETARIEEELLRNKHVVISGSKLGSLGSWIKHMTPEAAAELIGQQAVEMVQLYNGISSSRNVNFRFELASSGKLTMRAAGVSPASELDYEDPFGRSFSILNGHIDTPNGRQKVQLIIGHHYSNIRGCMSFIQSFYSSHVQCFISGWCASHMYYQQASQRDATLWRSKTMQRQDKVAAAITKYQNRGYRFKKADADSSPKFRTLSDGMSIFVDYSHIYTGFMEPGQRDMFNLWLEERKRNLDSLTWMESNGSITIFSPMGSLRRGNRTFAAGSRLPVNRFSRLMNIIADGNPCGLTGNIPRSSVGRSLAGEYWHISEAARSGTVYGCLQDATPWSWAL